MFIYLVSFAGSSLFSWIASRLDNNAKKNKKFIIFFSIISILITSVLAGLRNVSIGTDVNLYVVPDIGAAANSNSIFEFAGKIYGTREPGYLLLFFLVSRFTNDPQWIMFVMSFITISGFYIGAYKHKDSCSVPLIMLAFYLLFYNQSLNLVRQYMGLAIVFCGLSNLERKEYKKYIVYVIIAASFHLTSLIGFAILAIDIALSRKEKEGSFKRELFIAVLVVVFILSFEQLIKIVVSVGILPVKYLSYFNNLSGSNITEIILYFVEMFMVIIFSKAFLKNIEHFRFYRVVLLASISLLLLSTKMFYGSRLCLCFETTNIILLIKMQDGFKKGGSRIIYKVLLIAILVFYWYYIYVIGNSSATVPYISCF